MYRIIDDKASGKTGRLMLITKENDGVFICSNPYAMRTKAHAYGLTGFDIISYDDYQSGNFDPEKPCFVDELDNFVKSLGLKLNGYTLNNGD